MEGFHPIDSLSKSFPWCLMTLKQPECWGEESERDDRSQVSRKLSSLPAPLSLYHFGVPSKPWPHGRTRGSSSSFHILFSFHWVWGRESHEIPCLSSGFENQIQMLSSRSVSKSEEVTLCVCGVCLEKAENGHGDNMEGWYQGYQASGLPSRSWGYSIQIIFEGQLQLLIKTNSWILFLPYPRHPLH